jgi:4-carboxymuconolactone decarboxylase
MRALITMLCLAAALPAAAQSTLTVFSSNATNALIHELHAAFEKAAGVQLHVEFDNSTALRARIETGDEFDVAILTASVVNGLLGTGKLAADTRVDVARAGVGLAIHPSATKPDITTLSGLRNALLAARSITYVEQGATAPVLRSIFDGLGIAAAMKAKTIFSDNAAAAVAARKADIGLTQISEILNVPGAVFAGPLPREVQVYTTFQAVASRSASPAARRFIAMLTGPEAAAAIRRVGLEPVSSERLPPIPADQLTPDQRAAVDAFKTARGADVSGPFHPLLRSPELMTRTRAMGDYLRYKSALPPRLSEFVILLTAREWSQQYEWNAHYPIAIKAGVTPDVAQAVAEGRRPAQMSDEESILYDFCTELHHTKAVSDATYARALKAFGEQGVMDMVGITGYYSMLGMVLNTARTPAGDAQAPLLKPLVK